MSAKAQPKPGKPKATKLLSFRKDTEDHEAESLSVVEEQLKLDAALWESEAMKAVVEGWHDEDAEAEWEDGGVEGSEPYTARTAREHKTEAPENSDDERRRRNSRYENEEGLEGCGCKCHQAASDTGGESCDENNCYECECAESRRRRRDSGGIFGMFHGGYDSYDEDEGYGRVTFSDRANPRTCRMNNKEFLVDAPVDAPTAEIRAHLHRLLDAVGVEPERGGPSAAAAEDGARPGTVDKFVHHGTVRGASAPRLVVNGKALKLPLAATSVKTVIAAAKKAPFGRGENTVYDDAVRNTWQLEPAQVSIDSAEWEDQVANMTATVATTLGLDPAGVSAKLYKCLLYEEGGHFVKHRDTEKEAGMIASMIVVLPSKYTGGVLNIYKQDHKHVYALEDAGSLVHFIGFYSDCEHELLPIESGTRLCLVYNLFNESAGAAPVLPAGPVGDLAKVMMRWNAPLVTQPCMLYVLDHNYSAQGLEENGLKGRDRLVVAALEGAREASQDAFDFEAGVLEIGEYAYGDDAGWTVNEHSAGFHFRHCNLSKSLDDEIFEPLCKAAAFTFLTVQPGRGDMDKVKVEPTGNEGTNRDRQYKRAVIMMWPTNATLHLEKVDEPYGVMYARLDQWMAEDDDTSRALFRLTVEQLLGLGHVSEVGPYIAHAADPALTSRYYLAVLDKMRMDIEQTHRYDYVARTTVWEKKTTNEFGSMLDGIIINDGAATVFHSLATALNAEADAAAEAAAKANVNRGGFYRARPKKPEPVHTPSGFVMSWLQGATHGGKYELAVALLRTQRFFGMLAFAEPCFQLLLSANPTTVPWDVIKPAVDHHMAQLDTPAAYSRFAGILLQHGAQRAEACDAAVNMIQSKMGKTRPANLPVALRALYRAMGDRVKTLVVQLASLKDEYIGLEVPYTTERQVDFDGRHERRHEIRKGKDVVEALDGYLQVLMEVDATAVPEFLTHSVGKALADFRWRLHKGQDKEVADWWLAAAARIGISPVHYHSGLDKERRAAKKGKEKIGEQLKIRLRGAVNAPPAPSSAPKPAGSGSHKQQTTPKHAAGRGTALTTPGASAVKAAKRT